MKRFGLPFDLVSAKEFAFVSQRFDRVDQLNGIDIVYVLRFRIVSKTLMIAGEAQDVVDPQCRGAQNIALNRDAVAIAADQLPNGSNPISLRIRQEERELILTMEV